MYSTAQIKTLAEEVDLWHHILGHCDAPTLISPASPSKVANFPSHITPTVIRKHFPIACPDCPQENLQRHPSHYSATSSPSVGTEFEIDYKEKWTDANGCPAPTFQKDLYSFTAVDANFRYIFTKLCRNRVGMVDHLE